MHALILALQHRKARQEQSSIIFDIIVNIPSASQ